MKVIKQVVNIVNMHATSMKYSQRCEQRSLRPPPSMSVCMRYTLHAFDYAYDAFDYGDVLLGLSYWGCLTNFIWTIPQEASIVVWIICSCSVGLFRNSESIDIQPRAESPGISILMLELQDWLVVKRPAMLPSWRLQHTGAPHARQPGAQA